MSDRYASTLGHRSKGEEFVAGELTCPFCHAAWSPDNMRFFDLDCGDHCQSGRFYAECATMEIVCHSCGRLMYRKEGQELR